MYLWDIKCLRTLKAHTLHNIINSALTLFICFAAAKEVRLDYKLTTISVHMMYLDLLGLLVYTV